MVKNWLPSLGSEEGEKGEEDMVVVTVRCAMRAGRVERGSDNEEGKGLRFQLRTISLRERDVSSVKRMTRKMEESFQPQILEGVDHLNPSVPRRTVKYRRDLTSN